MKYPIAIMFLFLNLSFCGGESTDSQKNSESKSVPSPEAHAEKRIIFFGDSLTAGLGLNDFELAWPHLVVTRLKTEGFTYQLTNAGVSGDTTSGGLGRLDWVLSQKPDIFVLELGANDMLRGVPPKVTRGNLALMLKKIKTEFPDAKILLIGMMAIPNLGKVYKKEFDAIYPELARAEGVTLVPFLLEKTAGNRRLNQKDGIHPTEEGHRLIAETVYPYVRKLAQRK